MPKKANYASALDKISDGCADPVKASGVTREWQRKGLAWGRAAQRNSRIKLKAHRPATKPSVALSECIWGFWFRAW
jgi:hypothetical protein